MVTAILPVLVVVALCFYIIQFIFFNVCTNKQVSIDGEAKDQQILSTGITDRNIDDYLGIIEQRIDDLIQMSNAASHHPLPREDFLRMAVFEAHRHHVHAGPSLRPPPTLPSLNDVDGGDDDNLLATLTNAGAGAVATNNTNMNATNNSNAVTNINNTSALTAISAIATADDATRTVQPINIALLKEYMAKKMTKQLGVSVPAAYQHSSPHGHGHASPMDKPSAISSHHSNNNAVAGIGVGSTFSP